MSVQVILKKYFLNKIMSQEMLLNGGFICNDIEMKNENQKRRKEGRREERKIKGREVMRGRKERNGKGGRSEDIIDLMR